MSHQQIIHDLLTQKRLLMVTGKGGIGKTLVTCALAKMAVSLGKRVLLVEQSSVEQVGPLIGVDGVGHEEKWSGSLGVANFTAGGNFRDFITKHLMKSSLLDMVVSNKIVHSFFTAIPGFSELMLLGRMYYAMNLAPGQRPDLVILDGFASGHFRSLMTTPDAVLRSGLAGPIYNQTLKVKEWLSDAEQCATIYVAVPEDLVVSETLEFLPDLAQKSPVKLGGVIMNRCLAGPRRALSADNSAAGTFLAERWARQQRALEVFYKGISGLESLRSVPVTLCPELGSISEPLSSQIVSELLGGVHESKH